MKKKLITYLCLNGFFLFLGWLLVLTMPLHAQDITILVNADSPPALFAASEIQTALENKAHRVSQSSVDQINKKKDIDRIILTEQTEEILQNSDVNWPETMQPEGFSIRASSNNKQQTYWVIGADAAGVMYGGLELAEMIHIAGLESIQSINQNPYMQMRGTKFNIPLDVRTPSYSDASDAAQHNIAEMWSFDFWKEYIDNLARYRYNFISLWSLHPFPSLVKVPEYPDIALEDVQRTTIHWEENYSLQGKRLDAPEILENTEVLKKITIEEKINFWRKVMAYAKGRNVDFYVVTWNIFTNGTFGKYGITDDTNNATTRDYFRQSVKQMFLTYPDLAGIGLTTGENMEGAGFEEKEDWAFETYAQGVLDAAKEQPGRKITFIHRQHQTGALDIAHKFKPLVDHPDIDFIFSFKYAQAHVYSSTTQPFHPNFVEDIKSEGNLKTIWTLRNDDIYYFRWGAPDFVREFMQNIPYDVSQGYYYGSDQYIWGREFLSKAAETPRQLEVVKHWYHWMLWGRLGYDPNLSNERFIQILQAHFPEINAEKLFTAWQEASMIYPITTGFHWGALDFQWYIEGSKSRSSEAQTPSGFHDVNRFISLPPHESTNYASIPEYVNYITTGVTSSKISPLEVSGQLHAHADKALEILESISPKGNKELRLTLEDIRAMAYLGKYYAHKILGATELALFRVNFEKTKQEAAVHELNKAAEYWRLYAATALSQYENPLWTNRVGYVDWRDLFNYVLYDITTIGGEIDLASMSPTKGGKILEAENAVSQASKKATEVDGYTGSGYLAYQGGEGERWTEWTFEAPEAGTYVLELRYILRQPEREKNFVHLTINGEDREELILWNTGGSTTWAWDRKTVTLKKGKNTIKMEPHPEGISLMDYLNILYAGPE
jgi:hypothetical protein